MEPDRNDGQSGRIALLLLALALVLSACAAMFFFGERSWLFGILCSSVALITGFVAFSRAKKVHGGRPETREKSPESDALDRTRKTEDSDQEGEPQEPLYVLLTVGPAPDTEGEFLWDLSSRQHLILFYKAFADGASLESRSVGDSEEAIDLVRGVLETNRYKRLDVPPTEKSLYREGDECYLGAGVLFAFVCPEPQDVP